MLEDIAPSRVYKRRSTLLYEDTGNPDLDIKLLKEETTIIDRG